MITRNPRPLSSRVSGLVATVVLTGLVTAMSSAVAQDAPKQDPPSADAPKQDAPPADAPKQGAPPTDAPKQDAPKKTAPPSLDDLLGIGGGDDDDAADADASDPAVEDAASDVNPEDAAFDQRLAGEAQADPLVKALDGMRLASTRLAERKTDITTQRTQEDVLRRLDQLIDSARNQQQQQQSQSQQQQQQQQQQDPGQQQSGQQQAQPGQPQAQAGQEGDESGEESQVPFADGARNEILQESRAEWGSLPERVRQMLLQGSREHLSSIYEQMTRAYYRSLAEEGSNP